MPTALIVEDEPEANKLLGMLVRLRGYQIQSAFTGREALELIGRSLPDIVFLDLMLPDLSGYEICKILKSSRNTCLIPLVIVTARIAAENCVESYCLGANDYIAKPYTPDQIFLAMENAVRWSETCRAEVVEGHVRFGPHEDCEVLRRLGQLRSLLLARSGLSLEAVMMINRSIKEIWCLVEEWTRDSPDEMIPSLAYSFTPPRLTLEFRQASDWLARIPSLMEDAESPLHLVGYDEIHIDTAGHGLVMEKSLPPP